jgi:hypothetical protein
MLDGSIQAFRSSNPLSPLRWLIVDYRDEFPNPIFSNAPTKANEETTNFCTCPVISRRGIVTRERGYAML